MPNFIVLYHHMGLGDHFICNGLVNYLSTQYDKVILPCARHNLETVQCLYSDNDRVSILPVDKEPQDIVAFSQRENIPITQVGFDYIQKSRHGWYDSFYEQCGIPIEYRKSYFSLPSQIPNATLVYNQMVTSPHYILVHQGSSNSTEYPIDILQGRQEGSLPPIVRIVPHVSNNLLDWITVIQNAAEIHVVPSSVFCLVDGIAPSLNSRLYYHDIRQGADIRHSDIERSGTNWKVIKYDTQL
jgi:hypothetical protein